MTNVISVQHEAVQEFIKALGLDPKGIAEMHIHFIPDAAVTVEVIQFIYDTELNEMERIVKKYHLITEEIIKPEEK